MSEKVYIIPDIHEKVLWIEQFIAGLNGEYDKIVFLGDYFDHYQSSKEKVDRTAKWLKYSLYQPRRVHVWGNHDIWYGHPSCEALICPGNTLDKQEYINAILKSSDWNRLVLYAKEQGFYLSHGGLHGYHFEHPVLGISDDWLSNACQTALEQARGGLANPILLPGRGRGGRQQVGGITWLCWSEFRPIKKVNQIVGHTCCKTVRYKYLPNKKDANSVNVCLDTNLRYLGVLEDGRFTEIENPILGSW
jgi:predicted phosphodiesterase